MEYEALYRQCVEILQQAGIEEAVLDARLLLEEVCHTDRNYLLAHGDSPVTAEQEKQYREWIGKRAGHIPLQHILGYQEFMGLRFLVTPQVLIPRQDTEILVEEVLKDLHDGMRILDMCTGSGCILLSLLRYSNDCQGTGVDISDEALAVARENSRQLGLDADFVKSDLFENIENKYDIIVSNPPYIASGVIPALMEEVREHDPHIALDGGEDGLFFYREIIREAGAHLYSGGTLFFEIGFDQAAAVSALLEQAGFHEISVYRDLTGNDRVISGIYIG